LKGAAVIDSGYNAAETAATTARLLLTSAVMSQSKKAAGFRNHAAFIDDMRSRLNI